MCALAQSSRARSLLPRHPRAHATTEECPWRRRESGVPPCCAVSTSSEMVCANVEDRQPLAVANCSRGGDPLALLGLLMANWRDSGAQAIISYRDSLHLVSRTYSALPQLASFGGTTEFQV